MHLRDKKKSNNLKTDREKCTSNLDFVLKNKIIIIIQIVTQNVKTEKCSDVSRATSSQNQNNPTCLKWISPKYDIFSPHNIMLQQKLLISVIIVRWLPVPCLTLQTTQTQHLSKRPRTTCASQEVPMQSCIWQHLRASFFPHRL